MAGITCPLTLPVVYLPAHKMADTPRLFIPLPLVVCSDMRYRSKVYHAEPVRIKTCGLDCPREHRCYKQAAEGLWETIDHPMHTKTELYADYFSRAYGVYSNGDNDH